MLNNIDRAKLIETLRNHYAQFHPLWAERTADRLIATIDPALERNVQEWIGGHPLTDIWVCTSTDRLFSVATIMELNQDEDFVSAISALNMLLINEPLAFTEIFRERL